MTRNNLKWVLITAPDAHGMAQVNIAAQDDGGQVAIRLSGYTASQIAHMLIAEMHFEYDEDEEEETVH